MANYYLTPDSDTNLAAANQLPEQYYPQGYGYSPEPKLPGSENLLNEAAKDANTTSTTAGYDYGVDKPELYAASSMGAYSGSGYPVAYNPSSGRYEYINIDDPFDALDSEVIADGALKLGLGLTSPTTIQVPGAAAAEGIAGYYPVGNPTTTTSAVGAVPDTHAPAVGNTGMSATTSMTSSTAPKNPTSKVGGSNSARTEEQDTVTITPEPVTPTLYEGAASSVATKSGLGVLLTGVVAFIMI